MALQDSVTVVMVTGLGPASHPPIPFLALALPHTLWSCSPVATLHLPPPHAGHAALAGPCTLGGQVCGLGLLGEAGTDGF